MAHVHLGHGAAIYQLRDQAARVRYLVCEDCGRTVVVPAAIFEELGRQLETDHGFVLGDGHFAVMGHCAGCAAPRTDEST